MLKYYQIIDNFIEDNSRVIDIGCGSGDFIKSLQKRDINVHGIELESAKVSQAVANGLSVIQGDADNDLQYYPDNGFDYAVLALSLQNMKNPKDVLQQCQRIAQNTIIVIPNFGHIHNRLYFTLKGRMPVTSALSFQWYETPNIHFCTIIDFIVLCNEVGGKIKEQIALYADGKYKKFSGKGRFQANLFAEYGVFMI